MRFVRIEPGEFMMGCERSAEESARLFGGEASWYVNEFPRHRAKITAAFELAIHPVTRGQFARFVEATKHITSAERDGWAQSWTGEKFEKRPITWRDPQIEQTDDHPVVCVSYDDAIAFCKWMSQTEGATYRLPTEAEWEYACRAGKQSAWFWGDDPSVGNQFANCADLTGKAKYPTWTTFNWSDGFVFTSPVGSFQPNAWGLQDLAGNVWEFTSDYFGPYSEADQIDPTGPAEGTHRVLRGGSWFGAPLSSRCAYRSKVKLDYRGTNAGFRVVREIR